MIYFVNTIFLKETDVFLVETERTPVFFDSLERAKEFVRKNECDWQEAGYYNYAHIQGVAENCCYPLPDNPKTMTHLVYKVEEGWEDCKVTEYDNDRTLEINGKPVLKKIDDEYFCYTGTVEIG